MTLINNRMKKLKVLYFGALSELTGRQDDFLEIEGNLHDLVDKLKSDHPGIGKKHFSIAVNQEITSGDTVLSDGDEIALLPPFAGG